jgi:hypothetical protein
VEAEPLRALPRAPSKRVAQSEKAPELAPGTLPTTVEQEPEPQGPEQHVEQTFYTILRAIKKYDYDTVLTLSDQKTWDYFTELRELALTADRAVLEKLKPINRFQILALRHLKGAQELVGMNEKRLFEQAVLQGWFYVGDKPDVRIDYIDLMPGGNEALADIIVKSIIPDERLEFTRDQGIWKMNLLQLLPRQEENMSESNRKKSSSKISSSRRPGAIHLLIFGIHCCLNKVRRSLRLLKVIGLYRLSNNLLLLTFLIVLDFTFQIGPSSFIDSAAC